MPHLGKMDDTSPSWRRWAGWAAAPVQAGYARVMPWLDFPAAPGIPVRQERLAVDGRHIPLAICEGGHETVLMFFHGGGWMGGAPMAHAGLLTKLAETTSCRVVSVGYRLVPRWPLRAAVDDCWAAVRAHAGQRLILMGESAGAAMALWCARQAPVAGLVLVSPVADLARSAGPLKGASRLVDLGVKTLRPLWYDAGEAPHDWQQPRKTPALVITGAQDPLKADARAIAKAMDAQLVEYPRMTHGFFSLARLFPATARAALAEIGGFVSGLERGGGG
jgi:acetyl esterase/lipase